MVLIFGGVSRYISLGFFISKIIRQKYSFQAKKGSLSVWWLTLQKTENDTFLD